MLIIAIIASGRSHRHVAAVADQLLRALKESGHGNNAKIEGLSGGDWVLIDMGDIIIHIFRPEVREFYNLEKMWQAPELDGETVHLQADRSVEQRSAPKRLIDFAGSGPEEWFRAAIGLEPGEGHADYCLCRGPDEVWPRTRAGRSLFGPPEKDGFRSGLNSHPLSKLPRAERLRQNCASRKESARVLEALDQGGILILLDERGKTMPSEAFAASVARFRDDGKRQLLVAIGGLTDTMRH